MRMPGSHVFFSLYFFNQYFYVAVPGVLSFGLKTTMWEITTASESWHMVQSIVTVED